MLVLTRKKGERVLIGDDIVVTLIDVRGDGVRIGFDAPRGVAIQRAEVLSAVTEANTESAKTGERSAGLLVDLLTRAAKPPAAQSAEPPAGEQPRSASGRPVPGPLRPRPSRRAD